MSTNEVDIRLSSPQYDIYGSPQPVNLFLAGVGSGKSFLISVLSLRFIKQFPESIGLIAANTYDQLNRATMVPVREIWKKVGLTEWRDKERTGHYVVDRRPPRHFKKFRTFDSYHNIISFSWGANIFKATLENYKPLEGIEVGWAALDETKDTREEAVREVIIQRLRQKGIYIDKLGFLSSNTDDEPFNPLYILTSPAKVDWINEWFELDNYEEEINALIYDKQHYFRKVYSNKFVTISSTYHNEANLPSNYIEQLLINHTDREGRLKESGKRLIYGNPFVKAGGEFYSSFDRQRHVGDVPFIQGEPVHISMDFNVKPYITMTCYQIIVKTGIKYVRQFDEFCLENPNNSSEALALHFKRAYGAKLTHGLFYYGDPSGMHSDTRTRRNDYQYIAEVLREYLNNQSDRVPYKAPAVISRRDFVNNILDEKFDIRIMIDRRCRHSIADFEYVKEDADGKKLKSNVRDSETGQSYEKYGHTSDSFDYFITEAFKPYFERAIG